MNNGVVSKLCSNTITQHLSHGKGAYAYACTGDFTAIFTT